MKEIPILVYPEKISNIPKTDIGEKLPEGPYPGILIERGIRMSLVKCPALSLDGLLSMENEAFVEHESWKDL